MCCLVIDDNPLSVQIVRNCIANTPFLEASGDCNSAIAAAEMLRTQAFDVLFLDVEMPLMSGLDLLRTLPDPPQVVLITSSQSYAVQAFEFAVADYLLKPPELRSLSASRSQGIGKHPGAAGRGLR
ncbi:MAG: response regulator [Hymenobacter sp.]